MLVMVMHGEKKKNNRKRKGKENLPLRKVHLIMNTLLLTHTFSAFKGLSLNLAAFLFLG